MITCSLEYPKQDRDVQTSQQPMTQAPMGQSPFPQPMGGPVPYAHPYAQQPMAQPPMPAANDNRFMVPQPLAAPPAAPTMDVSQLDAAFNPPPAAPVGLMNDDLFAGLGPPATEEATEEEEEADADDVEFEEGDTPVRRAACGFLWDYPSAGGDGQS